MPWTTVPVPPVQGGAGWPVDRVIPDSGQGGGVWLPVYQHLAADEGVGFDEAALLAHLAAADTGTGQDRATLLAHILGADSAVGQDRATLLAHLLGADTGVGEDAAGWLLHLNRAASDTGIGSDAATLLAHLTVGDTGTGQDAAALLAHLFATDAGIGEDTARPAYMNGWTGSRGATVLNHATWTDLFSYTAAGNGTATATFTVSHSWGSNGFHWASEQRGVRVLVDGAQVASQMQSYTTSGWSSTLTQSGVTVPAGATVQIQGYGETTIYAACRTVTVSSAAMTIQGVT